MAIRITKSSLFQEFCILFFLNNQAVTITDIGVFGDSVTEKNLYEK